MFHFSIKSVPKEKKKSAKCPECRIDEFQLATMIRIFKSRNRELYAKLNQFYDEVVEHGEG